MSHRYDGVRLPSVSGSRRTIIGRVLVVALALIAVTSVSARGESTAAGTPAPELSGGPWIGSAPLTMASLRGRVVLVEFWTYG